jgi:hypothetical protein
LQNAFTVARLKREFFVESQALLEAGAQFTLVNERQESKK